MVIKRMEAFCTISTQNGLGAKIDGMFEELLDYASKDVGNDHSGDLVSELEFVEDLLDIW